jgi:hypothetical protein
MGGEKQRLEVRGGAGRCPFCRDLITDPKEVVACAGCGARQHESCFAQHGACTSCGATDVLVHRSQAPARLREAPPKGSRIEVRQEGASSVLSWPSHSQQQLRLIVLILAISVFGVPLIPFVLLGWWLGRDKYVEVVLGEGGLSMHKPGLFGRRSHLSHRATREDVGAVRLNRWGAMLTLTVDIGVNRIHIANAGRGQPSPLKEPEVEWLYDRLQAWKAEA